MQIDSGMNVYEACIAEKKNSPKLDFFMLERGFNNLGKWLKDRPKGKYYMLLCNELRYYTLFNMINDSIDNLVDEVRECAESRVEILDIGLDESTNEAYEIWIKDYEDGEPHVFMFFNYDLGVIEVE